MASTKIRADNVSNDITHSVHRLSNHSSPREKFGGLRSRR
ncbi:unnamed protein product [Brassica oleracea var. botrytis]